MIFLGKVNKNDGALLDDLKRGIRRWCEPDITAQRELLPLIPKHYQVVFVKLNVLIDVTSLTLIVYRGGILTSMVSCLFFKNVNVIGKLFIFQDVDVIEIWHSYRKSSRHSTGQNRLF